MTTHQTARLRCPICANPDWHDRTEREECTHCGLQVDRDVALADVGRAIVARLAAGRASTVPADRWGMAAGGWRNAAWRFGYVVRRERAIPAPLLESDVTLAVMTRPADVAQAAALFAELPEFARRIVLIDAPDAAPWTELFAGVECHAHPLDGDFAAQRNRLQALAGHGWVLQLDSDESPDPRLLESLGWLVAAADDDGLQSLGLARCNLVDGVVSALFPDIQYRLNRAEVRFEGRVHERPVVPFERTSLALAGMILHQLDSARVVARTEIYGAMADDGARPEDEARLLRPFDPIADR